MGAGQPPSQEQAPHGKEAGPRRPLTCSVGTFIPITNKCQELKFSHCTAEEYMMKNILSSLCERTLFHQFR